MLPKSNSLSLTKRACTSDRKKTGLTWMTMYVTERDPQYCNILDIQLESVSHAIM